MRPLNRPMFRYGGPIKEGIMQGMQDGGLANNEGPRRAALVGNSIFPKDAQGRSKHFIQFALPLLGAGARMLAPRAIAAGARAFGRGVMKRPGGGFLESSAPNPGGIFTLQRLKNLLPSQRFRTVLTGEKVPLPGGTGFRTGTRRLSPLEVLRNPEAIGRAVRENPFTTFAAAGQIKNIPDIAVGGAGLLADTALGATNYLLGTDFARGKKDDLKTTDDGTGIKRGDLNKTVPTPEVTGDVKNVKSDTEKQQINEDRINETKQKYYKLMGIDKMNKDAVYDSLIDASRIVSEEGADLKGSIKSGALQNRLIQAIGKNLDKSADLKKAIDSAVLKGEIQKDINLTKPSAFAEQVEYIRNNPDDPLAKKLSGMTSVADNLAALADKPITSDIVGRLVTSKGTEIEDIVKDDKYQKWEKNNENKDEIDYLQEITKGGSLDAGIYIVNKKAIRIDEKGNAFPVDLDSIIG